LYGTVELWLSGTLASTGDVMIWYDPFSITVLWHQWLGGRKKIWPVKLSDELPAWLSVWSKVQMTCIWSSWCYWHPIISCFIKVEKGKPFWCLLTWAVLEKRLLNGCCCCCCCITLAMWHRLSWNKCPFSYTTISVKALNGTQSADPGMWAGGRKDKWTYDDSIYCDSIASTVKTKTHKQTNKKETKS